MPLRLVLRKKASVPLEVEDITPDAVRGKSLAEIEKLDVFEGNVKSRLADFFAVSGDPADEVHERGKAGHLVGAAYRGSAKGMTKGMILVGGEAGNEIGHSMRRGTIAIGGSIGDLAGINMLAGSILVFGESGIRHGAGMKRGTIAFLGNTSPPILPTFRRACRYRPEILPLI